MPPYTPVKSKSQSRALFALAGRGEISEADARGKTRAAGDFSKLPEKKSVSGKPGKRAARKPKRYGPNRSR